MNSSEHVSSELRRLVSLMCDDQLSPEEHARLEEILMSDASARAFYRECMMLHGELSWNQMARRSASPGTAPSAKPLTKAGSPTSHGTPVLDFLSSGAQQITSFFSRSFVLTFLLAIGLPIIVLTILLIDIARQPVATAPVPPAVQQAEEVAEITRTHDAKWSNGDTGLATGTKLIANQQFRLLSGLAEITFADGAKVLLEGPATFNTQNDRQGLLQIGNLVAKVPKGAEGFTIVTPSAKIVDLGTEFGVSVLGDGTAEACVFQGEIEVATRPAARRVSPTTKRFVAGESVQVSADKVPQVVAKAPTAGKFIRHIPGTLAKPTIIFAHRGSKDPTTEGWRLWTGTPGGNKSPLKKMDVELGPVDEDGVSAWSIRTRKNNQIVYYSIGKAEGLTRALLAEARQKGWVFRARIWISDKNPIPPEKWAGVTILNYRDHKQGWTIYPDVDGEGNQCLDMHIGKNEMIPIPQSRNRYVDYEIRCHPNENSIDVYINGRHVAKRPFDILEQSNQSPQIRFGGWRPIINARFALIEWGILREPPNAPSHDVDRKQ